MLCAWACSLRHMGTALCACILYLDQGIDNAQPRESVLMKAHKLLLVCGHVHSGAGMNGAVCLGMFIQAQG